MARTSNVAAGANGSPTMATGHMQAIAAMDGGVGEHCKQNMVSQQAGGRDGHQSVSACWRPAQRSSMVPAHVVVAPACFSCFRVLDCMPPTARLAQDSSGRQRAALSRSALMALTGCRKVPRQLPVRRCHATTGRMGPVATRTSHLRPSVVFVNDLVVTEPWSLLPPHGRVQLFGVGKLKA